MDCPAIQGGDAAPSPTIAEALAAGCELLEVRFRRWDHERLVDLAEVVWPRGNQVHTLARALRCQNCKDERARARPDLGASRMRHPPAPSVVLRVTAPPRWDDAGPFKSNCSRP